MPRSLPILINAAAGTGNGDGAIAALAAHFRAAGAEPRIEVASSGAELLAIARKHAAMQAERLVAGGGDGTLNAVASVLAGSRTALGVLPLGTLNHFARDLGIPADPADAARVAVQGRPREIDVGEVNGRLFINNSGIGLYPAIVRRREKQRRRLGRSKWHAMLWAAHNALRAHPFLHLRLEVGGREALQRTPFLFIGNNVYRMQGFDIGVRERLDAGVLSLYLARRRGRLGLLLLALRALLGRLYEGHDFEAATARALRIESRHTRLLVALDGEIEAMSLPLEYRIRPRALRVVAP